MGRKRTGKRERFFFYLACILIGPLVLGGCALKEKFLRTESQDLFIRGELRESQDLMTRGEYSRALEKNRKLLERYPQMGDSALFQMGLITAHPKNPGKDYKKSLRYFQRLIAEFPKSDLKNQAQIWVLSLQEVIEKNKRIADLQRQIENLKEIVIEKDKNIADLQSQIEKLKEIDLNIQEKKKKSLP